MHLFPVYITDKHLVEPFMQIQSSNLFFTYILSDNGSVERKPNLRAEYVWRFCVKEVLRLLSTEKKKKK